MSLSILVDGPLPVLNAGDRFEIAADLTTDATRLVRRDYNGDPMSLTFDFGAATAVVFRMVGPKSAPVRARYLENQLKPLQLVYQRSRRFA